MSTIATRLLGAAAEWTANMLSPHVPVNEGIAAALMLQTVLKGKDVNDPPGSPAEGEGYIVGATPTGAFVDVGAKNVAFFHNGGWRKVTAIDQLRVYADDGAGNTDVWEYDGTDWNEILSGGAIAWLSLSDTPGSFSGEAGKVPAVNGGETALEFKASPYDVPVVKGDTPIVSEVIARYTLARDVAFAADFAGSAGSVETNPDATFDIDVQDDGTSIGTVSISTSGAYTFTTVGNTAKTVAAGSKLEFIAPDPVDASVEGISFMLLGSTVDI